MRRGECSGDSTDPVLFRKILDLGHEQFATDRKTYYIDCRPENVPAGNQLTDAELPSLLDDLEQVICRRPIRHISDREFFGLDDPAVALLPQQLPLFPKVLTG